MSTVTVQNGSVTGRPLPKGFLSTFSPSIYHKVQHKTLNLRQEVYTRYEDQSSKMSSSNLGLELDILITFKV